MLLVGFPKAVLWVSKTRQVKQYAENSETIHVKSVVLEDLLHILFFAGNVV